VVWVAWVGGGARSERDTACFLSLPSQAPSCCTLKVALGPRGMSRRFSQTNHGLRRRVGARETAVALLRWWYSRAGAWFRTGCFSYTGGSELRRRVGAGEAVAAPALVVLACGLV
jgi:hypothetical protein